jgi:ATP-dependent RNA helicase RhlE
LSIHDFSGFGLAAPLRDGLTRAGFTAPTPIQVQAIGPQMQGRDILGIAQTGSGKTAAFGLPMLHQLLAMKGRPAPKTARALILAPTRELAVQIDETLRMLAGGARLSTQLVLGGMSRSAQVRALARGVDVVIATPGRITDLMQEGCVRFDETRFFVLDEADRMLDMGFVKPVQRIAATLHPRRQTALFSATMPAEVEHLAAGLLNDPLRVEVTPPGETVAKIAQSVEIVDQPAKRRRLAEVLTGADVTRAIVFARTKRGADRVVQNLEKDGVEAAAIHGDKAQNARQRALKDFSAGRIRVLVATDIAARGIDVRDISHVIQHDLPDEPEAYVHRIGRTGRNGAEGIAIAFCTPDERDKLRAVEKLTRLSLTPADAPWPVEAPRPQRRPGAAPKNGRGRGRGRRPRSAAA